MRSTASETCLITVFVNGESVELPREGNVQQLLDQLSLRGGPVAVELNRELVPAIDHATTELRNGDRLEIVSLTGGG